MPEFGSAETGSLYEIIEDTKREDIRILKNESGTNYGKRYFVTAAIAGAELDVDFFESVQTYCRITEAELVILPMRGIKGHDCNFCPEVVNHGGKFATQIRFNSNLVAQDFMLNPQMINPLTGLKRYGHKKHSLIIASPKQFMQTVPMSNVGIPHMLHSTGTITIPDYAETRQGRLAEQDHCRGGLIVEVKDKKTYHIRQVQADDTGGFYDLGKYYSHNRVEQKRASAFIMADYHAGFQSEQVIKNWIECIKETNPKYIVFHDLFDGHSINPHHKNDMERQVNRNPLVDTLQKELDYVGNELLRWHSMFPNKILTIVYSNHPDFLRRYLTAVEYAEDTRNHRISLDLAGYLMDGFDPMEKYITEKFKIPNVLWLKEDGDYKLHNVRIGNHGHKPRGRGVQTLEEVFGDCIIGHSHAPKLFRSFCQVGTSTPLKLDYNAGNPTDWLNTSALLYKNGSKQLINSIEGEWRLHD
jgi:hypothetical protein